MELGSNGRQKQERGEAIVGMMEKQTDFKVRQSAGSEHQGVMLCAGVKATAER